MSEKTEIVMCCFCGESLKYFSAIRLSIKANSNTEEEQTVYCHAECQQKVLHPDVPLHPDFYNKTDE